MTKESNDGIVSASAIEMDRAVLDASIGEFVEQNAPYYTQAFAKIHARTNALPVTFNKWAAALGPFWSAARAMWGFFWVFLIAEIIAWVQIGGGLWGSPGAEFLERAAQQQGRSAELLERANVATKPEDVERFTTLSENIGRAAQTSLDRAAAAQAEASTILLWGLGLLIVVKLIQGLFADVFYEKQYTKWRIDPESTDSGVRKPNTYLGAALVLLIGPLIVYKFTVNGSFAFLDSFPEDLTSRLILGADGGSLFAAVASWMEGHIDAAAASGAGVFDGIVRGVRSVLDALTVALNGSPWPVVMLIIIVTAWRAAGPRVAIFTAAALSYIALLGYWEIAMETVALVGAAVILCVAMGIPLGIWFGKSQRAFRLAEPVLDLMQTLPAFVYLIPIIAFFGTGNPPGILATIIFGMPPVIRLTALGMRGVPESIKEAAVAFGASRWQLLKDVEVPLALPSIMAGVNQTILMCLSMVVIISLIGGGGLGKEILEALQFAAKGPGLLGGFAILFVAMVIDRIVQGAFKSEQASR